MTTEHQRKLARERRQRADEKKRRQGLIRVPVWIPAGRKAELLAFVRDWCD